MVTPGRVGDIIKTLFALGNIQFQRAPQNETGRAGPCSIRAF
jgi:hypothetical protein